MSKAVFYSIPDAILNAPELIKDNIMTDYNDLIESFSHLLDVVDDADLAITLCSIRACADEMLEKIRKARMEGVNREQGI